MCKVTNFIPPDNQRIGCESINLDFQLSVSTLYFLKSFLYGLCACQDNTHTAVTLNERLAEETNLNVGLGKYLINILKLNHVGVTLNYDSL